MTHGGAHCRPAPRSLGQIARRKRELVERAAGQREVFAGHVLGLAPVFAVGDKVLGVGRYLLSRPLLLAGAGGLMAALWPRAVFRLLPLALRGVGVWKGVSAIRRLF